MTNAGGGPNFIYLAKRMCAMSIFLSIAFLVLVLSSAQSLANTKDIYLVRHFEKQKPTEQSGRDVSLTAIGIENAQKLAGWMQSNQLSYLFTTDYKRTKQSIHPTAMANALKPIMYDPSDLAAFAEQVKLKDGNTLVLGHSNTTGFYMAC
jgi:phosphohistidine phosphatase SixA